MAAAAIAVAVIQGPVGGRKRKDLPGLAGPGPGPGPRPGLAGVRASAQEPAAKRQCVSSRVAYSAAFEALAVHAKAYVSNLSDVPMHREAEIRVLRQALHINVTNQTSQAILLSGPPGLGKRLVLQHVLQVLQAEAEAVSAESAFDVWSIDCASIKKETDLFGLLVKRLKLSHLVKKDHATQSKILYEYFTVSKCVAADTESKDTDADDIQMRLANQKVRKVRRGTKPKADSKRAKLKPDRQPNHRQTKPLVLVLDHIESMTSKPLRNACFQVLDWIDATKKRPMQHPFICVMVCQQIYSLTGTSADWCNARIDSRLSCKIPFHPYSPQALLDLLMQPFAEETLDDVVPMSQRHLFRDKERSLFTKAALQRIVYLCQQTSGSSGCIQRGRAFIALELDAKFCRIQRLEAAAEIADCLNPIDILQLGRPPMAPREVFAAQVRKLLCGSATGSDPNKEANGGEGPLMRLMRVIAFLWERRRETLPKPPEGTTDAWTWSTIVYALQKAQLLTLQTGTEEQDYKDLLFGKDAVKPQAHAETHGTTLVWLNRVRQLHESNILHLLDGLEPIVCIPCHWSTAFEMRMDLHLF